MTTKNKIEYGSVEIPAEAFEPKNVKERITIFLDEDVVEAFRKKAKQTGEGYQTLINQALRRLVFGEPSKPIVFPPSIDLDALQELLAAKEELLGVLQAHKQPKAKKRA